MRHLLRCAALYCGLSVLLGFGSAFGGSSSGNAWICDGYQDGTSVSVHVDAPGGVVERSGAVRLGQRGQECTGRIHIDVWTSAGDGIKVGSLAHDLVVTGRVTCRGREDGFHQDGIQALAGRNVRFEDFVVDCPTSNNGGIWIEANNHGRNGEPWPTDVVCVRCDLLSNNAAVNIGAHALRSGAIDSVLHRSYSKAAPPDCVRNRSTTAVLEGNTCG